MSPPHRRRPRYPGTYPRRFDHKYKELDPGRYPGIEDHVIAKGNTPAGSHLPVLVAEVLDVLRPRPGEVFVDATLGRGGHALRILEALRPGGRLIGIDVDPIELPRTTERIRLAGFAEDAFLSVNATFAALPRVLEGAGVSRADGILADLGVSSMQLDDPARGFTLKAEGPLDMRMNPGKGEPARALIRRVDAGTLAKILAENGDEPAAAEISAAVAGRDFPTTAALAEAVRAVLSRSDPDVRELAVRRVFQALRMQVNRELPALEALLRVLPDCLAPGGRAAILSFHSGEDRRVKRAFQDGLADGTYAAAAPEPIRCGPEERRANPRAAPAKLRWAVRAPR